MQTGFETAAFTVGFELFDTVARGGGGRRRRPPGPDQAVGPSGAQRGGTRRPGLGQRGDPLPRGLRSRPRGGPHRQGRLGLRGPGRSQVASPLVTLVDDGTIGREWGTFAIDDEGHARRAQRPHRERRPHRLHVGLPAGPQGGAPVVGQRPPAELPAPPHGADDQHLPARRRRRSRRASSAQTPTASTWPSSAAARSTPPPGDFVFGTAEAYLIEDGEITEPLRDANLIGNGPRSCAASTPWPTTSPRAPGTCGKDGQSVPVGTGQPTLRITGVTIGGTAGE